MNDSAALGYALLVFYTLLVFFGAAILIAGISIIYSLLEGRRKKREKQLLPCGHPRASAYAHKYDKKLYCAHCYWEEPLNDD